MFPGEELRAQRELRDLSIEDVYRLLRVPASCIRALEAGDMTSLPALTYAMGFLRSYCEFLELDPDPYLDCLQECAAPAAAPGFLRMKAYDKQHRPAWVSDAITWATISAILALGWFTYTVVVQPGASPSEGRGRGGYYCCACAHACAGRAARTLGGLAATCLKRFSSQLELRREFRRLLSFATMN